MLKRLAAAVATAALVLLPALPAAALELSPIVTLDVGTTPSISTDPTTGTSLIAYLQDEDEPATVKGVIVDAELNVLVGPFALNDAEEQVEFSQPFAEWNPDAGNWLVGWDNDQSIFGRVVDPATGPVGAVTLLAAYAENDPTLDFDDIEQVELAWGGSANGYLVGFKANTPAGCQEIYGVLADAAGEPQQAWATVLSSEAPGQDEAGEGCEAGANDGLGLDYGINSWLVAWKNTNTGQATARLIGVSGDEPERLTTPVALGPINIGAPTVLWDAASSRFLSTWGGAGQIRANFVSEVGTADAADYFVVDDDTRDFRRARVAYDSSTSSFVYVAHDSTDSTVWSWELAVTATSGPGTGTTLSAPEVPSVRPAIAAGNGCVIVVWDASVIVEEDDISVIQARSNCANPVPAPGLANTGLDVTAPLVAGGILLAAGLAAFGISRRRDVNA